MFFVPAMNLGGIPPLSGFLGKLALVQAAADVPGWLPWLAIGVAIVTSLLTLWAVAKAWNRAFWQPAPEQPVERDSSESLHGHARPLSADLSDSDLIEAVEDTHLPRTMAVPTLMLVVVGLALTVLAGPLFSLTERSAHEVMQRDPYIQTVLGDRG